MCRNCREGICQNKCVAPEPDTVNLIEIKPVSLKEGTEKKQDKEHGKKCL
ncbi:hypothetical protein FIV04_25500 (plasmid) [Vibrio sp. THAF190c]|jgi:hypothetical protein|nr:hypothetical protein FIV04_25500 [Vibrio sp. THAF190c]